MPTLRMKGFSLKWIGWIKSFISGGSIAINVNDEVGPFFKTKQKVFAKGILLLILFNIMADMLAFFINRAKIENQLHGVVPHLVDDDLSILQ